MNWLCVTASFERPPEDWSGVHDTFDRHGCPGTVEQADPPSMSAYMFEGPEARLMIARLGAELLDFGASSISVEVVPEEDWAETWKQFFKPRKIGERFLVTPSWEEAPEEGRLKVVLDPGQAFGTGEHPTTEMCLELLEAVVKPGDTVVDIGTGSGILSIGAAMLQAKEVRATEIDPAAAEAALANFERNGVDVAFVVSDGVTGGTPADVVVSNIVSAVLIRLAADVARATRQGGKWIVSGVIEDNWRDVVDAATAGGFDLAEKRARDGWIAAILVRR